MASALAELTGNTCGGARACVAGLREGHITARFLKDGPFSHVKEFPLLSITGVCCELVGYVEVE